MARRIRGAAPAGSGEAGTHGAERAGCAADTVRCTWRSCRYTLLDLETPRRSASRAGRTRAFRNFVVELPRRGTVGRGEGAPNRALRRVPRRDDAARLNEVGARRDRATCEGPRRRRGRRRRARAASPAGPARRPQRRRLGPRRQAGRRARLAHARPRAARPCGTSYTIAIDEPEEMLAQARAAVRVRTLKVKLGFDGDVELARRLAAELPETTLPLRRQRGLGPRAGGSGARGPGRPRRGARRAAAAGRRRRGPGLAAASARPYRCSPTRRCSTLDDLDDVDELYDGVVVKLAKAGGIASAFA